MSDAATTKPFARGPGLSPEAAEDVKRWHLIWAAAVAAAGALITVVLGRLPGEVYLGFAALAAAGLLGSLMTGAARSLLVLWGVAVAFALAASGGMTGPGAPWLLALFAAAMVLRRRAVEAAILAVLAVAVAWAAEVSAVSSSVETQGALRLMATAASLATTAWALVSASTLRRGDETGAVVSNGRGAILREQAAAAEAARLAAEAERDAANEANAGKSRFLANMSHELRTPLNAIMGFADIMRNRLFGPLPDRYAEYAQLIHESGQHLLDLINDVLDMSKIEADRYRLSKETFDARDAVNATLRLMRPQAEEAGIEMRGLIPDSAIMVDADKRALKQIALNLISNALKFTPRGCSVTVTLAATGGALELAVADTGIGVAPEDLERLGRPYEQAGDADSRARGTGLGLSLVRSFAGLHGGEMMMESVLGEGTAVTVRLPVLAGAEPEPATGEVIPFVAR